ncbi:MAG: hypothetical protein ABL955_11165 [Elusimicrobiota bacterium]
MMIRELLAHTDYLRVFHAIERRPVRFFHLKDELELHPPQISRALKFLVRKKLIVLRPADTATGIFIPVYTLTDRGTAIKEVLSTFTLAVNRRRSRLGSDALLDLRRWWT